jgi:damage-control phosphatase, subfamily I
MVRNEINERWYRMEITLDCIPCMLKQALEASRMVTDDIEQQDKIIEEVLSVLLNYTTYRNSPDLAREIHQIIKNVTRVKDPYYKIKSRDLKAAKELYIFLSEFMKKKDGSIYWALKIAATGNNIDAAIHQNIDVKKCVERELEKEFTICDLNIFENKLKTASNILIIGDNAGETVFDKILIENMPKIPVIYGVRSEPILNDTTKKEAYESGLGEVSTIVSTGCNAPGTILEDCSKEFMDIYNRADIIISKGQGNFEALSEKKGNLFFLLKAKCPMIADKLSVYLNNYVFKYNGE